MIHFHRWQKTGTGLGAERTCGCGVHQVRFAGKWRTVPHRGKEDCQHRETVREIVCGSVNEFGCCDVLFCTNCGEILVADDR